MGIHKPKSRDEADFARRRLIFDDFFYLQVSCYFQLFYFITYQKSYSNFNVIGGICAMTLCTRVAILISLCML
jgi:hypothetical protein